MSIFSSYKKIFLLGFAIVILIAIPFSVYVAQQRQRTITKATQSTVLSFEPASPTIKVGEVLTLNVWLNPGIDPKTANQVSFVKLSISFDQEKFTTAGASLVPNPDTSNTLTSILENPVFQANKASISLSIGADPTRAVTTKTKIAILKLKATNETTPTFPNITFDPAPNTEVLSIASLDETSENVLSTTIPATVTITTAAGTSPTPSTTTSTVSVGNAPICVSLSIDRSTTGTAPYSLTFTAIGNDSDGTISKASFNFGDGPVQALTTGGGIGTSSVNAQISHTYSASGTFTAYAILTDNKDNLSAQQASCTKTITVNPAGFAEGGALGGGLLTQVNPTIATTIQKPIVTTAPEVIFPSQTILPPTGPGEKILGIGAIGAIFTIIGTVLLILL